MHWIERRGINYLVDGPHNQIVAEVKPTSRDVFQAKYGILGPREYPDLEDARSAMVAEHERALKAAEAEAKALAEKKPNSKKPKKGNGDAAKSA